MTIDAWPFLIARTEKSPPRLIVAPDWALSDRRLRAAVRESPRQVPATAVGTAVRRLAQTGQEDFWLVYRVIKVRKLDYGVGEDEPAYDQAHRQLEAIEGLIIQSSDYEAAEQAVGSADLDTVHAAVIDPYRAYWQQPKSFRIHAATSFPLSGRGDPITVRVLDPWRSLEYERALKALAATAAARAGVGTEPAVPDSHLVAATSASPERDQHRPHAMVLAIGAAVVAAGLGIAIAIARPWSNPSQPVQLSDPGGTEVTAIAFSSAGVLATGDKTGSTYLWNVATSRISATLPDVSARGVYDVAFSPDGKLLATADGNGTVRLWDVATAKATGSPLPADTSGSVASLAFSPNGTTLATGGNGTVELWNVATGTRIFNYDTGSVAVGSVAFSPDGRTLAAGGDGTVLLLDAVNGQVVRVLDTGSGAVSSVAFSPDGRTLATGGEGGTVLWDLATGRQVETGLGPASSVAFSPDGKILATASGDGTIRLWDLEQRKVTETLDDPDSRDITGGIAFSPDGKTLAAGDGNAHAYIWSIT